MTNRNGPHLHHGFHFYLRGEKSKPEHETTFLYSRAIFSFSLSPVSSFPSSSLPTHLQNLVTEKILKCTIIARYPSNPPNSLPIHSTKAENQKQMWINDKLALSQALSSHAWFFSRLWQSCIRSSELVHGQPPNDTTDKKWKLERSRRLNTISLSKLFVRWICWKQGCLLETFKCPQWTSNIIYNLLVVFVLFAKRTQLLCY